MLLTSHEDDAIVETLLALAKRGKLAGYQPRPEQGVLFLCDAQGTPWDRDLLGVVTASPDGKRQLAFTLRSRRRIPIIFAVVLAFTVWPGVILTDSLLATWFGFYSTWSLQMPWLTYAWYLPLTALPIPWMWRSWMRKTDLSTRMHAHEQVTKIATALDARTT